MKMLIPAALAAVVFAFPANAAKIKFINPFFDGQLAKFDPALGTLTSIDFHIAGTFSGYFSAEYGYPYNIVGLAIPFEAALAIEPVIYFHSGDDAQVAFNGPRQEIVINEKFVAANPWEYREYRFSLSADQRFSTNDARVLSAVSDLSFPQMPSMLHQIGGELIRWDVPYGVEVGYFPEWEGQTVTTYNYIPLSGAVPEPSSWAMMIGGFALVGTTLRRSRRANRRALRSPL